ncbi:hypothetical protein NLJ89_g6733 [Agrocybe chaxingu]|uniref:Uncharacterized protein n=1 Tax=Agrocybe chaxingu TaxID=84603 RepID=A0A9W8JYP1_9AGAR|nr:hypothetical protein NLJ89_g6733 [Agrocybe chaxingu]
MVLTASIERTFGTTPGCNLAPSIEQTSASVQPTIGLPPVPRRQAEYFRFISAWRFLAIHLFHLLVCISTIGTSTICFQRLRYAAPSPLTTFSDVEAQADVQEVSAGWGDAIKILMPLWKLVRIASAIFLPLCLALLQIDSIRNSLLSRTFAISALIFSFDGLLSSCVYVGFKDRISSSQVANQWVEASSPDTSSSVRASKFWAAIVTPMSSMAWCVIWFMLSMFVLAWNTDDVDFLVASPSFDITISGVWASFLVAFSLIRLVSAIQMLIFAREDVL